MEQLLRDLMNWRLVEEWNHPDHNTTKTGLNTEKSPGDPRRLAVTQTSVKDYQFVLMWKNSQGENNIFYEFFIQVVTSVFQSTLKDSKSPRVFSNCGLNDLSFELQFPQSLFQASEYHSNGTNYN